MLTFCVFAEDIGDEWYIRELYFGFLDFFEDGINFVYNFLASFDGVVIGFMEVIDGCV